MGLELRAKDYPNKSLHIEYPEFEIIRIKIAELYNTELGYLYKKFCDGNKLTKLENDRYNKICDYGLDLLLFHSDFDGELTWQDCKIISKSLDRLDSSVKGYDMNFYILGDMIKWCGENKETLYFK